MIYSNIWTCCLFTRWVVLSFSFWTWVHTYGCLQSAPSKTITQHNTISYKYILCIYYTLYVGTERDYVYLHWNWWFYTVKVLLKYIRVYVGGTSLFWTPEARHLKCNPLFPVPNAIGTLTIIRALLSHMSDLFGDWMHRVYSMYMPYTSISRRLKTWSCYTHIMYVLKHTLNSLK